MTLQLSIRQRRVLTLLADEITPVRVPSEMCAPPAMQSLERRGLVKSSARGYRITKQGREVA